jgi:hypothetical protein
MAVGHDNAVAKIVYRQAEGAGWAAGPSSFFNKKRLSANE